MLRRPYRIGVLLCLVSGLLAVTGCGQDEHPAATEEGASEAAPDDPEPARPQTDRADPEARRRLPIELPFDHPTDLALEPETCHRVALTLGAGEAVEVTVEQAGTDVEERVFGPSGGEPSGTEPVLQLDAPVGPFGVEGGVYVASEPGGHRLEICPFRNGGSYRLTVSSPRAASRRDRLRAEAALFYLEGRNLDKPERRADALRSFEKALELWRRAEDLRGQAWAWTKLGVARRSLGDLPEATLAFERSASLFGMVGNRRQEAVIFMSVGRSLGMQGRLREALTAHRRALRLAERLVPAATSVRASALHNVSVIQEQLGYAYEAIEGFRALRALRRAEGDPDKELAAIRDVGRIYQQAGDVEYALGSFSETLSFSRSHGLIAGEAEALEDLGRAHREVGRYRLALRYFREALEIKRREKVGNLAETLNNLGMTSLRLGDVAQGRAELAAALEANEGTESPAQRGEILVNLAYTDQAAGQFSRAVARCREALTLLSARTSVRVPVASAYHCIAENEAALGHLEDASRAIEQAIEIMETIRDRSALVPLRASLLAKRYDDYELAIEVLVRLDERQPGRGFAERSFEMAERARARTLVDRLAELRRGEVPGAPAALAEREDRLAREIIAAEQELLDLEARASGSGAVERVTERLRDLREEHRLALAAIRSAESLDTVPEQTSVAPLEEIRREVLADDRTEILSYFLGEDSSYVWLAGLDRLSVRRLPGRSVIDPLAERAAELLAQSADLGARVEAEVAAERLSEVILGTISDQLRGPRIALVLDGTLHGVPFASLPLPRGGQAGEGGEGTDALLIERFELVELPSASSLPLLRRRRELRAAPPRRLALFGDPVFAANDERLSGVAPLEQGKGLEDDETAALSSVLRSARGLGLGGLERLRGSRAEVEAIAELVPAEERLVALGFDATRAVAVGGALESHEIVHFATHGLVHPRLSGILLSAFDRQGRRVPSFLGVTEVYGLEVAARLIVLSACRTARGKDLRGEGPMGLSRGFLSAGASTVLVSEWDVDDLATDELMVRFYHGVLEDHLSPAAALRSAQLSMRSDARWAPPAYWAGFVLQGDWL